MKNILLLVCMVAVALSSHAGSYGEDVYLGDNDSYSYKTLENLSQSVLVDNDSTFEYVVWKESSDSVAAYANVSVDSVSGTASDVTFYFDMSLYPFDRGVPISTDTVVWSGVSDSTFGFSTVTNAAFYRIRMEKAGDAFEIQLDYLDFIFFK
jgi:hypothetical protein